MIGYGYLNRFFNVSLKQCVDMSVDFKVHDLMEDIAEQQEVANEIAEAISNPVGFGNAVDDDDLLRELEELEQVSWICLHEKVSLFLYQDKVIKRSTLIWMNWFKHIGNFFALPISRNSKFCRTRFITGRAGQAASGHSTNARFSA